MHSLEFRSVSKRFGQTEVPKDISLDVRHGEFLTIRGPSGCGKSTLLSTAVGLERPDSGSVLIDGGIAGDIGPAGRNIAMVFQSYALNPHLTVAQDIAMPLRVRRLTRLARAFPPLRLTSRARRICLDIAREVKAVADILAIGSLLDRRPHELSGSQRQRVALARAMIREPRLFLMDELLSNLDAKLRVQMRSEIVALHRRPGTAFVYVTHDQVEAMTMSDRVAVMIEGEIAQIAPPRDIYRDPETADMPASSGPRRLIYSQRKETIDHGSLSDRVQPAWKFKPLTPSCASGFVRKTSDSPRAARLLR
ncbi:ABC-type sugar transport system ATPase subunit [Bradyrhizobium sp. USDA 4369]